jgi:hypothetical protein
MFLALLDFLQAHVQNILTMPSSHYSLLFASPTSTNTTIHSQRLTITCCAVAYSARFGAWVGEYDVSRSRVRDVVPTSCGYE